MPYHLNTYEERVQNFSNPTARSLLEIMSRKKTNLCISVDVTTKASLLRIVDAAGPSVCVVKASIHIVEDFDQDLVDRLQQLSKKHDFLIFEDRKFYSRGVHRISSWSHITNAHIVPGPGVISGLARAGQPLGRGLLLLAEMSSAGALTTGEYTKTAVRLANENSDFVIGYIAMSRQGVQSDSEKDFLILTPGVGLDTKGDGLGQQYRTPREVIFDSGCDVIIVGRGIYGKGEGNDNESIRKDSERYRKEGWEAYESRCRD
ncbi:orotidine 5'-phosphate decarboxylase [Rhizoctonia solani AG-1 IA]|uniref:Orotidine 5'-phosphate decarboxylase n=1 Tax=Thanatephorus cucumeris (strain AG1-IA) TaxID=983506 RepID=L8X5K0_THACA|nr:orotidine 5'-phosphate decarboxylase [Rhizoctonia solani AG-1 IA]